nr:glycosyltransferase family A protein [Sporosarcina newyorkensis]
MLTNYNYGHYLSEAIESVLNQTYKNFELIIVDDGSTDNSKEIIQKYTNAYPVKIKAIFKENGGQGSAFNIGIENATGDVIAFLDADDYWYSTKLEVIIPYHQKYDGVQHNLLINGESRYVFLEKQGASTREDFIKYGFTGAIPTSGLSYARDVLKKKVGMIPEKEFTICADNYVRSLFLVYHDTLTINEPLGYYRAHSTNHFFNNKKQHMDLLVSATNQALERYNNEFNCELPMCEDHIYIYANRMYESLKIKSSDQKRYIIYGNGYAGNHYFERLKSSNQVVVAFASTYPTQESFNELPLWGVKELKDHEDQYDKILIASQQMVEIYDYLLEQGLKETKIIHPQM